MRTTITKEIIKNTYALYLKGVDSGMMSSVLSISPLTANREEIKDLLRRQCELLEKLCNAWGV